VSGGAAVARFAVRTLLPGPDEGLRDAVLRLGAGIDALPSLARHGAVEALALRGLAPDETRVLEREARALGAQVLSSPDGDHAVLLAPLLAAGELPGRLRAFSPRTAPLGDAIAAALAGRGGRPPGLSAGRFHLPSGSRTLVMGVINATPDSFSGDGTGGDVGAAVALAMAMVEEGADIVDVGGESTRPHSRPVSAAEELARVLPVIEILCARLDVPVSIDTRKASVARAAIAAGVSMVNDIWGLRADPRMAGVCAASDVAVVAMHNRRDTAAAGDLLEEVCISLHESVAIARSAGIPSERIAVDPGFGFGKTPAQNLELIRRLGELRGIGRPILIGPSRKSTLGMLLRDREGRPAPPEARVEGTLALAVLAVSAGADIIRVHDVAAAARAVRVADAVVRGTPAGFDTLPAPGPTG
jgi:dihydropteroate synthase